MRENVTDGGRCPCCRHPMVMLSRMRGLRPGMLPTVLDDVSWEQLSADHDKDCYWLATRGYRTFRTEATL